MKKYIYSISIILMFLVSCDDFLSESPRSAISSNNFFQTDTDAISALNGVYAALHNRGSLYHRGLYLMGELPTDNACVGQGVTDNNIVSMDNYTHDARNYRVELLWENFYLAISRANVVIQNVPKMELNETLKNRILGEARFLRALSYFNLVRFFGDVPLTVTPTTSLEDLNLPRSSEDEIYQLIIEDLTFSEQNLWDPTSTEIGRPTNTAAKGLLAKVYLTLENWNLAAQKSNEVMGTGSHGLMENFADVFTPATEDNEENIWSIKFKSGTGSNAHAYQSRLMMPRGQIPGITGWGADVPCQEFYDIYEEDDTRKSKTFWTETSRQGQQVTFNAPHWFKFIDMNNLASNHQADSDLPILRYSDVLLMFAEAENELNNGPTQEAYDAINMVRSRAFGPGHELSGLSQTEFRTAVWKERRLELATESKRWFDLKRTGRLVEVMQAHGTSIQDFHNRFPIPQREMDTNPKLTQNPGY